MTFSSLSEELEPDYILSRPFLDCNELLAKARPQPCKDIIVARGPTEIEEDDEDGEDPKVLKLS